MPVIHIPSLMRDLTDGKDKVEIEGKTLRQVIRNLEEQYPGTKGRLCDQEDRINPGISVFIDGNVSRQGLYAEVQEASEIHFLPAVGGG